MNVPVRNETLTRALHCSPVRVAWQNRIGGGYSAIAEEDAAGYFKGGVVAVVGGTRFKALPQVVYAIPKLPHHEI